MTDERMLEIAEQIEEFGNELSRDIPDTAAWDGTFCEGDESKLECKGVVLIVAAQSLLFASAILRAWARDRLVKL